MASSGTYGVDLAGLNQAGHGIQNALDELGKLGMRGEETSGSPIEDLALNDEALGSSEFGLANTVSELCGRAHYLARSILGDGQSIVSRLTETGTNYQHMEDTAATLFHRIYNDVAGDPLPKPQPRVQEVKNAAGR